MCESADDYHIHKVYEDASNFLKLCEELNVVPDLWSLHEWSVWLTPTFKRSKRQVQHFTQLVDDVNKVFHNCVLEYLNVDSKQYSI